LIIKNWQETSNQYGLGKKGVGRRGKISISKGLVLNL